ncbi:hypothetical protein TrVGV298_011204 [Trichoderma virens]|nr:hypothetical protein TrVGV298_011204 [Trichoderma virens]
MRRLSDPDALTKSNAAYAVGLLVQYSTDTAKTIPIYPQLWEKLEPMLSIQEMRITDNVAGALSRMMIKHADAGFVAQALPAIVNILPLQEEFEENEPIYQAIHTLYDQSNETVQQLTPQLIGIFEKALYGAKPDLFANNPNLLQLASASQ